MSSTRSYENKLMDDILIKLKSNIRNLFHCKRVCGICLNSTTSLRLGTTVYSISCGDNITEKSLSDIIRSTFGYQVTTLLPTCYFCESCIDVLLKAYRMLEEIKFNHQILQYYANKLAEQTKMKLPEDVQSIVFELDYFSQSKSEYHPDSDVNMKITNDGDVTSELDDDESNETLNMNEIKQEIIYKEEPKDTGYDIPIKIEISDIVAKIKDQITFKKIKTQEPKLKIEQGNFDKPKKVATKRKLKSKLNSGPVSKKLSKVVKDTKDRYYKCYLCETTFTGERELLKHSKKQCIQSGIVDHKHTDKKKIKEKDDDSAKKEVCDQCGKIVTSNYLRKHKRLHEKMQKQCPICAQFINKASFKRHMHSHSGLPKMRSCPNCDYETKYMEALDAHINKEHLHIRPYACEKCQKGFHSKLLLREHIKIHTRLKTEQCHLCGDRFAYKKSLMLHMRLHTGYTPYKCHLCDESFISASRRQTHIQSKHVGRVLQCDICSKKFSLRTTLRNHVIKIHQRKDKAKVT